MGYKISVNGEDVWESEGDALLVDRVNIVNARGEVVTIGSPGMDSWLKIEVNVRNAPTDAGTYLDIIEAEKAQERRDRIESESSDAVAEGRAMMESEGAEETAEEAPELGPPAPVPDMEF